MYNKEYFDIHTKECSVEKDEFRSMGFGGQYSAEARYDKVIDIIEKRFYYTFNITSVLDVGAGTGAMWTADFITSLCRTFPIKNACFIEPYEKYIPLLKSRVKDIEEFDVEIIQSDVMKLDKTKADLVISVGAMNYYRLDELLTLLTKLLSLTDKVLIFEVNIQSPITPVSDQGNFNPSISAIYEFLCLQYSNITIDIIRKYTSIWTIIKEPV